MARVVSPPKRKMSDGRSGSPTFPPIAWLLEGLQAMLAYCLTLADNLLQVFYYPYLCFCYALLSAQRVWLGEANIKTVVIVGGNFAGLAAVHTLEWDASVRVVLVDRREYFEYTPGVLRLLCEPALFKSLARAIPKGPHEFVLGNVTSSASDHVIVSLPSGETRRLDCDYLMLATGADYREPITAGTKDVSLQQRFDTWSREAARVRAAGSVLILGAGAVGVELAAEIACYYPQKKVTIINGQELPVPMFPRSTSLYAQRWLQDQGVEVLANQRVDRWDETGCTLSDGSIVKADVVYPCFGMRVNSQSIGSGELAPSLGPRQEVRVNEFLQVEGWPNVFAVGDVMINPSKELKQAYYAEMNGEAAGHNVLRHIHGKPLLRFPEDIAGAAATPMVYIVSCGRYNGSLGFNKIVINGPISAVMKWFIEWTKVKQMEGRPIGIAVWRLADAITFFLSRTLVKPCAKGAA